MSKLLVPSSPVERYFSIHYAVHFARLVTTSDSQATKLQPTDTIATTPATTTSSSQIRPFSSSPPLGYDTCVTRHHNGICLVCLSPRHPALKEKISDISFRVPFRAVRGKRKKGGLKVENLTRLCTITTDAGNQYTVQTGVKGIIVEYNERLLASPSLITNSPLRDGYLAVVLPFPNQIRQAVDKLMTEDTYNSYFQTERTTNGNCIQTSNEVQSNSIQ